MWVAYIQCMGYKEETDLPEGERESIKAKERKIRIATIWSGVCTKNRSRISLYSAIKGINEKQKPLFDLSIFQNSFSVVYSAILSFIENKYHGSRIIYL